MILARTPPITPHVPEAPRAAATGTLLVQEHMCQNNVSNIRTEKSFHPKVHFHQTRSPFDRSNIHQQQSQSVAAAETAAVAKPNLQEKHYTINCYINYLCQKHYSTQYRQ